MDFWKLRLEYHELQAHLDFIVKTFPLEISMKKNQSYAKAWSWRTGVTVVTVADCSERRVLHRVTRVPR